MKRAMKCVSAAIPLALVGLAPAISVACEYHDHASSASAAPPAQLATTPAPAATIAPAAKPSNALATKATKPTVEKAKSPAPEQKLAAVNGN